MRFSDVLQSAWQSLRRTKSRTFFTMLGIVVGVLSVILVLSIGEAAQRFILAQVSSFGSDLLIVMNGPDNAQTRSTPRAFVKEVLTYTDYRKLRQQPWVRRIAGVLSQSDTVQGTGEERNAQIQGTTPDEVQLFDLHIAQGVFFSQSDVDGRTKVAVLGADVATSAFGSGSSVGNVLKIGTQPFKVVGVMEKSGTRAFQNIDQRVYIPVTAGLDVYHRKYLTGINLTTDLSIREATRRTQQILRDTHRIFREEDDDFHVMTQDDLIRTTTQITSILQILLTSIAAISLIVGGIGIMNMMYVAVTERTAEIGLRKAIGGRQKDILRQFLVEAVVLTSSGGLIGVVLGTALTWVAVRIISVFQSGWVFQLSSRGILLGLGVSVVVGLVFGFAPAHRASSLHPIEALRKE